MVDIKIDTLEFKKGLSKASKKLEEIVFERVSKAGEYLKAETIKEAPSDTGSLRASIFSDIQKADSEIKLRVGSTSQYALYVHQGTGLFATNGNGRKTPWRVTTIYKAKRVTFWTMGQQPNPFLTRARDKNIGNIKKLLGVK